MIEMQGRLAKVVDVWLTRIEQSRKVREPFRITADICRNFFQGSCGFMWNEQFRDKYFSNLPAPRFKMTVAKGFEYCAIMGPSLYWDYAGRTAKPYARLQVNPEVFGADINDPAVMQRYQAFLQEYETNRRINQTRCSLMEHYLNYAQREQPNGGLMAESQLAITEALITGRGCLWTEMYQFPGSERRLTRSVYDSCLRLFIDPQCTKPNLSDCGWIARQHIDNYWDVERRFNLPEGSLKNAAMTASTSGSGQSSDMTFSNRDAYHHISSESFATANKIVWYEIYSKNGVGTRYENFDSSLHEAFESTIGDFAYLCIAKNVKFPLNFPPHIVNTGDDADIKAALDWPVPIYRDGRWPVSLLDFYEAASGPWPLAPVGLGLGELIFMNVMMSCLADRVYMNSRNIWAVLKEAGDDIISKIKGNEFNIVMELNSQIRQNINELVSVIESPAVNYDAIRMLEYISGEFDKRTGLTETMYGLNAGGKVTRTAADANLKESATSIRPEWMARKVEQWQTNVANVERIYAGWYVRGEDTYPLFGKEVAALWDQLIANEDPEVYFREMSMTIEANSIRKPNKLRDSANLTQIAQYLLPQLNQLAMAGRPEPLNAFIKSLGDAMEQDVSEWIIPSLPPQPPPPGQESSQGPMPQEQSPQPLPPQEPPMDPTQVAMAQQGLPPEIAAALQSMSPEMLMEIASGL